MHGEHQQARQGKNRPHPASQFFQREQKRDHTHGKGDGQPLKLFVKVVHHSDFVFAGACPGRRENDQSATGQGRDYCGKKKDGNPETAFSSVSFFCDAEIGGGIREGFVERIFHSKMRISKRAAAHEKREIGAAAESGKNSSQPETSWILR
jgi:hypothetical protein